MTTTPIFNSAATEPARREQASIAEGKRILATKMSPQAFLHAFGHPPPAKKMAIPARPAASGTPKHYAKETGPFEPRKLHVYTCKAWLAPIPA